MSNSRPDFFDANFSLLKKHYPELWQRFRDNPPRPTGEVVFSPQGLPNLLVRQDDGKTTAVHIESDPQAEIPQFLKLVPAKATGFVAFLGIGLGYTPLAFLHERPNINRMVIFELDEGIFWQALRVMDLAPLLKSARVTLMVGADLEIAKNLSVFMAALTLESIHTLEHKGAFALNRTGYLKLKEDFYRYSNAMNIGGNTVAAYGATFVENRFRHLSGIGHDFLLDSLQNSFSGTPAFLVAGGPSLNKNGHLLAQAKGKAVIIAVDTVIPLLLNKGIKPDFVGSIDMQPTTYEKYADQAHSLSGVSLICAPWVAPKVPKYLQVDRTFWFFSQNNMELWLHRLLGGGVTFPGAGTVAQLNFFAAVLMGCSPIIFVGQDFAFTDNQDHAEGTVLSHRERVRGLLAAKKELHEVPGTMGGTVFTDRAYLNMKQIFEDTIRRNSNTYLNATEGGAHIEGSEVITLQAALDKYCHSSSGKLTVGEQIAARLEQAKPPMVAALVKEFKATLQGGRTLLKTIAQSDDLGRQIITGLDKLERRAGIYLSFERLPQGMQKHLRKNDELHGKIDHEKVWRLLQDVTTAGLRETERMKVAIDQLQGDPARYLLWLRKNMERVLAINRVRRKVLTDFMAKLSRVVDNFEAEQKFLRIKHPTDAERLELARLYLANGDLRLAQPLLVSLPDGCAEAAEIRFMLGKIAALRADFGVAKELFNRSRSLAPRMAAEIDAFLLESAEEYLLYARQREARGMKIAARRMVLKGLCYAPDHRVLREKVQAAFGTDLALLSSEPQDEGGLLDFWQANLQDYPWLADLLEAEQLARLHQARGEMLFERQDYHEALAEFIKAEAHLPDDPELQIAIFEAAFNCQRFDSAVAALARAVELDRSLAGHWEELGDLLLNAANPADALVAYEKCFIAQPEHHGLLKKIGDCYLALDQPEAAREAYRQLSDILTRTESKESERPRIG